MRPAPLKIGPIEVWPPLVLAPMSGVTNRTMRALYRPFGLGLTVTEFVSSNALKYGSRRTMEMIDQHGLERPVSTQLWGDDPQTMALAAKVVRECGADIVDINFGCPAPKVTKTEGGSAPWWFYVDGSDNVMISGITNHGSSPLSITSSTNVNVNTSSYYAIPPSSNAYIVDPTASYPFANDYALFKLNGSGGSGFDNSVFPRCGDGVCDGGETTSNCSADCR